MEEEGLNNLELILIYLGCAIIAILIIFKIMFEYSIRNLHEQLPEAEMRIQTALFKIEELQAQKMIKSDLIKQSKQKYFKPLGPDGKPILDVLITETSELARELQEIEEKGKKMLDEEIKQSRLEIRQGNYELYSEISEKQKQERRDKLI